eukprot:Blabericola_migrator_1__7967@NODE_4088_length_1338_cov_85_177813_g1327_i2_p2_GENE_NODE_4088_length_1338_cov_85_177813_g1327_i2NODE_4088_length_1338_cov_85_177813_g1327_i2_p2_ORF_typecomplete_len118_score5_55Dna2/PF08696_11/0_13_NODE_4088_length_1338_cov_85_177813_g1327_i29851338
MDLKLLIVATTMVEGIQCKTDVRLPPMDTAGRGNHRMSISTISHQVLPLCITMPMAALGRRGLGHHHVATITNNTAIAQVHNDDRPDSRRTNLVSNSLSIAASRRTRKAHRQCCPAR